MAEQKEKRKIEQIGLVKGRQTYVFRYERGHESRALDAIVELANRNVGFDWFYAAVLAYQISNRGYFLQLLNISKNH